MTVEAWLPVVGYEGFYEISNLGNLRSLERKTKQGRRGGGPMKASPNAGGYPTFMLTSIALGKRERIAAHKMVLQAFVGPCPPDMEACHYPDRSPSNCSLSNLRWDTRRGNFLDKKEHGTQTRGEIHPVARLTEMQALEILRLAPHKLPLQGIAERFGVSTSAVSLIQLGKRWRHLQP